MSTREGELGCGPCPHCDTGLIKEERWTEGTQSLLDAGMIPTLLPFQETVNTAVWPELAN